MRQRLKIPDPSARLYFIRGASCRTWAFPLLLAGHPSRTWVVCNCTYTGSSIVLTTAKAVWLGFFACEIPTVMDMLLFCKH